VRDPGELASEVYWHFTRQVRRMDLGRVARVAATLVRNTERDLVRARRRTRESEALEETDLPACSPVEPDLLTSAIERLLSVVDARLVLGSVTEGREWEQLAEDCGLSVAAARKRVQRALARTRTSLAGSVSTGHSWPSRCAQ
jgi:DNA-directed RNA polymerase specialized sigma24 family protein